MFYIVTSDNLDSVVMTAAAYRELQLQMSTGDWHTHTAVRTLPSIAEHFGYLDLDTDAGDFVACGQLEVRSVC